MISVRPVSSLGPDRESYCVRVWLPGVDNGGISQVSVAHLGCHGPAAILHSSEKILILSEKKITIIATEIIKIINTRKKI